MKIECPSNELKKPGDIAVSSNMFELRSISRRENMKTLDVLAVVLLVVGGLNWGLVGLAHFDLVATIFGMKFGETSALSSGVYILVGLAALYHAASFKAIQRRWAHSAAVAHR
jgi:uncharacterized protein